MTKNSYNCDIQTVEPTFEDPKPVTEIPTNAYIIDEPKNQVSQSKLGSVATIAVGGVVALVGVPMLVLPGPGLLAIGGGVALMLKGAKGLRGDKK